MLELEATPQIFHALRKRGRMASRLWNVFTMFYWSFSSEQRLSLGSVSSALVGFSIAYSRLLELRFILPPAGVAECCAFGLYSALRFVEQSARDSLMRRFAPIISDFQ